MSNWLKQKNHVWRYIYEVMNRDENIINKAKFKAVLFDLDGTISDSMLGVKNGLLYASKKLSLKPCDLSDHSKFIGPPLMHTMKHVLGAPEELIDQTAAAYREYYNEKGLYENKLYGGMKEVLEALKKSDAKVAVASSKFEKFVYDVLDVLDIRRYFDAVCGSDANEESADKANIVRRAAKELKVQMNNKDVVLIGDSKYDAIGAFQAGCAFIGVTYGYGNLDDMRAAGAKVFVNSPKELYELLISLK